jgi:hypothetical protein
MDICESRVDAINARRQAARIVSQDKLVAQVLSQVFDDDPNLFI